MLDPVKLRTLAVVAGLRSFSAAARELHLTQPGVSRQVALLEQQLGARLLRRVRGGVEPTDAGRLLLEHARVVLDRLALAEQQVRSMTTRQSGSVRLGSFFSAVVHLSAEAGALLSTEHPDLVVVDHLVDRDTAFRMLGRGELDLALVALGPLGDASPPAGVVLEPLFDDPVRLLVPTGHPAAEQPPVSLAELAEDTWIRALDGGAADLLDHVLALHGVDPPRFLAGHGEEPVEVQALVASGRGITLTYDLTVVVSRHDLVLVPLPEPAPHRRIALASADGHQPSAVAALRDALHRVGADRRAALAAQA